MCIVYPKARCSECFECTMLGTNELRSEIKQPIIMRVIMQTFRIIKYSSNNPTECEYLGVIRGKARAAQEHKRLNEELERTNPGEWADGFRYHLERLMPRIRAC